MKKNFNRAILAAATIAMLISSTAFAATDKTVQATMARELSVVYNGEKQTFADAVGNQAFPILYDGTTYLPVRAIAKLFDTDIQWFGSESRVNINSDGKYVGNDVKFIPSKETMNSTVDVIISGNIVVSFNDIGKTIYTTAGNQTGPIIKDGTTYLPVRMVSELFNTPISWDAENYCVVIGELPIEGFKPDEGKEDSNKKPVTSLPEPIYPGSGVDIPDSYMYDDKFGAWVPADLVGKYTDYDDNSKDSSNKVDNGITPENFIYKGMPLLDNYEVVDGFSAKTWDWSDLQGITFNGPVLKITGNKDQFIQQFESVSKMQKIELPEGCTKMSYDVFGGGEYGSFFGFFYDETQDILDSISIGSGAAYHTDLTIPDGVDALYICNSSRTGTVYIGNFEFEF